MRRDAREEKIEEAGASMGELLELTELVDRVRTSAPADASLYELEELLERYAELTVAKQRSVRAVSRAPVAPSESTSSALRAVRTHVLAWRATCSERTVAFEEQRALISELLRLYVQRAILRDCHLIRKSGNVRLPTGTPTS